VDSLPSVGILEFFAAAAGTGMVSARADVLPAILRRMPLLDFRRAAPLMQQVSHDPG